MPTTRKKRSKEAQTAPRAAPLEQVLKSLSEPLRLSIVRQLLASEGEEIACGGFEHCLTKATFSHHIAILEKAGLVQARADGTRRLISLRREHLARHFPGLIELIRRAP